MGLRSPAFERDRLAGLSGAQKDPAYSLAVDLDGHVLTLGEPLSHGLDCSPPVVLYLIHEQPPGYCCLSFLRLS